MLVTFIVSLLHCISIGTGALIRLSWYQLASQVIVCKKTNSPPAKTAFVFHSLVDANIYLRHSMSDYVSVENTQAVFSLAQTKYVQHALTASSGSRVMRNALKVKYSYGVLSRLVWM